MSAINFKTTKEEDILCLSIIRRAKKLNLEDSEIQDLFMDLSATHCNGTPLDFEKLLNFDDFNFAHDIYGIVANINRSTGQLDNCFLPRCSK